MATSWLLIPALVTLREEFNLIAPNRSKESDGSIGDSAHQKEVSDHNPDETGTVPIRDADSINEVHAIDITSDLNEPGLTMEMVIQFLLARCRRSNSDPYNEARLRYIIYNRRIWTSPYWEERRYTGPSAHTEHAHFSAEYITSLEYDTRTWHLEDIPVALTPEDKAFFLRAIDNAVENIVNRPVEVDPDRKPGDPNKVALQPWSRVDGYGSMERRRISDKLDRLIELVTKPAK